jgi:hypothetical protein
VPIEFHGTALYASAIDGVPYVAIKPICDALTINWPSQLQRIKRHPVMAGGMVVITMPSASGDQPTVCLPLALLNGWLFGVSVSRVCDPARRARLIEYQRECFGVLAQHFGAADKPGPVILSVPKPGRYAVYVRNDGATTIKSLDGHSVIDADGVRKLQSDLSNVRSALAELSHRMRIVSGDENLSVLAQPLRVMLG